MAIAVFVVATFNADAGYRRMRSQPRSRSRLSALALSRPLQHETVSAGRREQCLSFPCRSTWAARTPATCRTASTTSDCALLGAISVTRVFAFVELQFGAVFGLAVDLLLVALRSLRAGGWTENAGARLAQPTLGSLATR
jgi:hypothetical protein